MDISKVTVRELLENKAACDAMNAIDPKILKSPMVKLVKGKTIEAVFNMVPDSKVSPEVKAKIREASPPSEHIWNKVKTGPVCRSRFCRIHRSRPVGGGCFCFVTGSSQLPKLWKFGAFSAIVNASLLLRTQLVYIF